MGSTVVGQWYFVRGKYLKISNMRPRETDTKVSNVIKNMYENRGVWWVIQYTIKPTIPYYYILLQFAL